MNGKKFVWIIDSCESRANGKLVSGETHDSSGFPAGVVDEWVKTGAARWVVTPKKSPKED
jgi:hypothetical protein